MRKESKPSLVYAIGTTDCATIKIGTTTDLPRRFAAIQAMSPQSLVVHWHTPGGADLERRLHEAFKTRRQHGEWFDFRGHDALRLIAEAAQARAEALESHRLGERAKPRKAAAPQHRHPTAEGGTRVPCLPSCSGFDGSPAQPMNAPGFPQCDLRKPGCLSQVALLALLGSAG